MPKFKVEQVALAPRLPGAAQALFEAMEMEHFVHDVVTAEGQVFDRQEVSNTAELTFCYDTLGTELEILNYVEGDNWLRHIPQPKSDIQPLQSIVSHLGMHCSEEDLAEWKKFFAERGVRIAQEVFTSNHESEYLKRVGRKYHYTIFDTRGILGVDLKFIVRIDADKNLMEGPNPVADVTVHQS